MGYLCFLTLFTALNPTLGINFFLNPLNFYSLKVTKFHSDSVKIESVRTPKLHGGGGAKRPPQPV